MIKSMTGFGRGEFADETGKVTAEIRTVNHRYLDISVKMPRRYAFAEEAIKAAVKEKLYRGKVEVSVSVDNTAQSDSDVKLDEDLAAKYYDALSTLRDSFDFGEESKVSLSLLARMPDVIKTSAAEEDEEAVTQRLVSAARKAVDDICVMRETEGAKLALSYAIYSPVERIFAFNISDEEMRLFSRATEEYLLNQLGHSFKTLDFYKKVKKN